MDDALDAAKVAPLLAWYGRIRRDMPWRRTRDPYAIWVSETMLQQTRVETVIPYYLRFLGALPTVQALAEAPSEQVLALWSGLGYYRRARMLHAAARRVVTLHGARLPRTAEGLRTLDGVGRYTAGAVASIAYGERAALVDGNVSRVFARLFAIDEDVKGAAFQRRVWNIAERLVAGVEGDPGDWNQALMELGATVCTPRTPRCAECPLGTACRAHREGLADVLPRVKEKAAPRVTRHVAVVLASPSAVLLARRREDTLFGGLWEPPRAAGGPRSLQALCALLGVDPEALTPMGVVEHVLSHRRLRVRVLRGALGRRARWTIPGPEYEATQVVSLSRLAVHAHATLVTKILVAAEVAKPAAHGLRSP